MAITFINVISGVEISSVISTQSALAVAADAVDGQNLGAIGASVFKQKDGSIFKFRRLQGLAGLSVVENTDTIDFSVPSVATEDLTLNCTTAEQVGEPVYINNAGNARRANASSITTAKVAGFITNKPTSTQCTVRLFGVVEGLLGLIPGDYYFLDTADGGISNTPPSGTGVVVINLGQAKSSTELVINPMPRPIILS